VTPLEFIQKWRPVALNKRQTAQEHFGDLCRLLREPTPIEADPEGIDYAFEKGANRATGGRGWADVWKRERFAMEYKKRHANLEAARKQLLNYAGALANPPLLLTCDTDRIEIHTNWNDLVSTTIAIRLEEFIDPERLQTLKNVFVNPDALRPVRRRADVTAEAAARFADLAGRLRRRHHPPQQVAHFVNQILFCLFAQDSQLFEERLFEKFLRQAAGRHSMRKLSFAAYFRVWLRAASTGWIVWTGLMETCFRMTAFCRLSRMTSNSSKGLRG
jgi:hypothetical protein